MMFHVLKKYLALYNHLDLDGIGNLNVEVIPAQIDIANRTIQPPESFIQFNKNNTQPDKIFLRFLEKELNIDETHAVKNMTNFTTQLQTNIKENNQVVFEGFGKLKKQSTDTLTFEMDEMPVYYPSIVAERIIRKNATHTVRVGEDEKTSDEMQLALQHEEEVILEDRWWIPAIILGLIGIAALIYYYNVLHPIYF